jgi:histidine triad (HIT) family protein
MIVDTDESCIFCRIASGELDASLVFEDTISVAFLDHRPLFHGHCLVIPKKHFETLKDLPAGLIPPFFANVQMLSRAVESAMDAEGTFVAMNNRVSQSVPHLHVHVVPRRKKDGLKGFFWPRTKYKDESEITEVAKGIRKAVARIKEKIATTKK